MEEATFRLGNQTVYGESLLNSDGGKMIMQGNARIPGKLPLRCALYLHLYAPPVSSTTPFLCYLSLLTSFAQGLSDSETGTVRRSLLVDFIPYRHL